MNYSTEIIDEVCRLRLQGWTVPRIAHAVSRLFPRYCQKSRKQKNFCDSDILKILQQLKDQERLPTTLLDDLKKEIGPKGKFKSKLTKPVKEEVTLPPKFF